MQVSYLRRSGVLYRRVDDETEVFTPTAQPVIVEPGQPPVKGGPPPVESDYPGHSLVVFAGKCDTAVRQLLRLPGELTLKLLDSPLGMVMLAFKALKQPGRIPPAVIQIPLAHGPARSVESGLVRPDLGPHPPRRALVVTVHASLT